LAIVDTSIRADATTIDAILTAFHAHPHIQAAAAVPNANGHATHPSNVPASTTHLIGYKGRRVPSRLTLNLTKAYEQARVAYMAREAAKLPSTGTHTDIASRCIAAWASNRNENLIGGTAAFNLRATRRAQRLSKAAYIILLTSTLGLPPPGAYLAVGATCCGRTTDAYHPHSCTAKGKAHVHDAVRTCHCHLNTCHPNNSGIRQLSVEARGKNFLNGAAGQGGPDACILDSNNLPTHLDYSGYNPFTQEHIRRALAQTTLEDRTKYTTANDQTRTNTRLDHQPAQQKDSVSARDATKMSGKDAAAAHAAGDRFLPLTFSHNGGLSVTFNRLLERTFIRAPTHTARWRYGCPSMSQAAVSILRATILNAVAANMMSNYECMFRKAGITEANSAFNMWSDARFPAAAPTLADFLNWMPSTEPPDEGAAEDIQESAEAALAATSQGI
jgi:hypothetical protein